VVAQSKLSEATPPRHRRLDADDHLSLTVGCDRHPTDQMSVMREVVALDQADRRSTRDVRFSGSIRPSEDEAMLRHRPWVRAAVLRPDQPERADKDKTRIRPDEVDPIEHYRLVTLVLNVEQLEGERDSLLDRDAHRDLFLGR